MKRFLKWGLGGSLILIGLLLIGSTFLRNELTATTSAEIVESLTVHRPTEGDFDFTAVGPLEWKDVTSVRNRFHDLPTIGVISIADVSLELPILYGLAPENLAVGAGTMRPSQTMGQGNYALAGHYMNRTDILFGPLHEVTTGMLIQLSDLTHTYTYRITSIETVAPTRVDVLDETDEATITLVTCTFNATERLIVKGTLLAENAPF